MSESGMTTAEYAVGTIAAAGLGGVLLKLLTTALILMAKVGWFG